MAQMRPGALLFWLGVAVAAHVLVALFGVLNRFMQVDPTPPLPAMRLSVLVSLFALGALTMGNITARSVRWALQAHARRCARLQPAGSKAAQAAPPHGSSSSKEAEPEATACRISADGRPPITAATAAAAAVAAEAGQAAPAPRSGLAWQQEASFVRQGSALEEPAPPPGAAPPRPELALRRGMSRRVRDLSRSRPRLVRYAALALITVTFSSAYCCQIVAPGFVDPSIVQLVNMFTVLGVALVQAFLLKHRLPRIIWPASLVMLGGAAMVIVPAIGESQSGGLDGWRGWLGFGLSIASMATTVVYFVALQACRRLGFTSVQLQYLYLLFTITIMLPLSLGIDGTNWPAQFAGWAAGDWAVLAALGCAVVLAANWCIQHSTWRLGAPTVSMFYGLRLVAAIVESKLILGTTIIKTGLQIAGTVVTVSAVTVYMAVQWWQSRQESRATDAAAGGAAAAPAADSAGGPAAAAPKRGPTQAS